MLAALAGKVAKRTGCEVPDADAFDDQGQFFQRAFLPQLYQTLDKNRRPVFLLDEFDVLGQTAKKGLPKEAATRSFFPFLRRVMAEDPLPAFVFAVGRRAEDLSADFTSMFKGALSQEIWVLDHESATSLILQAQANGTLRFTDQAVDRIWRLTSGHPYMTQLLCQRIWERAYAGNPAAPPQVDVPDVEAAVPGALEAGKSALIWLWKGLNPAEKIYAAALAEAADEENETISEDQVVQVLGAHAARLRTQPVELAPRDLVKRRVLEKSGDGEYRFAVELFRCWVRRYQPLRDVKDELDRMYPKADEFFNMGQRISRQGEWKKAVRYFEDALEKDPRHFHARLQLGEALLKLDRADEAMAQLEQAYELDRDEARLPLARALVAQAEALEESGDEDRSLAIYMRTLEISPNEKVAQERRDAIWTRRGNAAMEQGDLNVALAAYQQTGVEGWQDAVTLVRRALESDPSLFRTRFRLGEVLLELDQTEEAMAELDAALAVHRSAGVDRREEAIDFFQLLLEEEPRNVFARLHLGELLMTKGRINEAIDQLEQAYDLDPAKTRPRLAHALMAQAQAAREAGDRLAVLESYVRVMQVDPSRHDALEVMERTIAELQRESARVASSLSSAQEQPDQAYVAPRINRRQLGEILRNAESQVRLLGIVALDPDWPALAKEWADKLTDDSGFEVTVLCESDNFLFSKAFTLDTDMAKNRRSFWELKFIRDRATVDFPALLLEERVSSEVVGKKVELEIMHLPMPISIVQVDDRTFANLWLHEVEDFFEEVTQRHPWHSLLGEYVSTYFDPARGRKYARNPGDEVLELFDHKRVPRGIYPRRSFYDTDYSQLVVWAFVFDRRGRLLIHRRSDNAKDNQGMWDKSVGGHVEFTDFRTSRAAFREVVEELFVREPEKLKSDLKKWAISDEEFIYLGEWRPNHRKWHPFREISSFKREWAFFRLRESEPLYSPRTLPDGKTIRRLRVIPDIFLFVAGPQLTDEFLDGLENSTFKLIEISELKSTMDKALSGEAVPGFDANKFGESKLVPEFTPDLKNIMTGKLRDILEEFSQPIMFNCPQRRN